MYSAIVVYVCLRLPLKSTRTAHVYIPNTYYARAWRHRFQESRIGCLHGNDNGGVFKNVHLKPVFKNMRFSPQNAVVM